MKNNSTIPDWSKMGTALRAFWSVFFKPEKARLEENRPERPQSSSHFTPVWDG